LEVKALKKLKEVSKADPGAPPDSLRGGKPFKRDLHAIHGIIMKNEKPNYRYGKNLVKFPI
jgi:hypothetical protein